MNRIILRISIGLISLSTGAFSQGAISQAELNRMQAAVENTKIRIAGFEKKIADADSLINAGKTMIDEAKAEIKQIDSESIKFEKEFAERYKPVKKLTGSKDKAIAKKAATDLKALDTEHRKTNDSLLARMNSANRKQTAGVLALNKGKNARAAAQEGLKNAENILKAAQKKYDDAKERQEKR